MDRVMTSCIVTTFETGQSASKVPNSLILDERVKELSQRLAPTCIKTSTSWKRVWVWGYRQPNDGLRYSLLPYENKGTKEHYIEVLC